MTALAADTLFGHVCWAIRHQFGETKLNELLTGYTEDQAIFSRWTADSRK